jgi:cysteine-S-conjugate beta-lyase
MDIDTNLLLMSRQEKDLFNSDIAPLYSSTSYNIDINHIEEQEYSYSRIENPTRTLLQEQLAALDNAIYSHASPSGLSAINTILSLLQPGNEIIFHNNIYGGTYNILIHLASTKGIILTQVDMCNSNNIKNSISKSTKLILMESPSNPLQEICNIREICLLAKNNNIMTAIDNSVISSYYQKPLNLGVDFSIQSATKYLCGHGDITAGVISVSKQLNKIKITEALYRQGNALSPHDSWLLHRSLKTLGLRMKTQQATTLVVAKFLNGHPLIKKVNYLGLTSHPQYELHRSQASGTASTLSFNTKSIDFSKELIKNMSDFFKVTPSFGSVNSSVSLPYLMSHQNIFSCPLAKKTFTPDLIRISIGIEQQSDILNAINNALEKTYKR